jgi:hypothetical protein
MATERKNCGDGRQFIVSMWGSIGGKKEGVCLDTLISICGDGRIYHERDVISSRGAHRRPAFKVRKQVTK